LRTTPIFEAKSSDPLRKKEKRDETGQAGAKKNHGRDQSRGGETSDAPPLFFANPRDVPDRVRRKQRGPFEPLEISLKEEREMRGVHRGGEEVVRRTRSRGEDQA